MEEIQKKFDFEKGCIIFYKKLSLRNKVIFSLILIWASIVYGFFFYDLLIEKTWPIRKGDMFFFLFLGFIGVLSIFVIFKTNKIITDKSSAKIKNISGLFWRKHHTENKLSEFNCITIVPKYSLVTGVHKQLYEIYLSGSNSSCLLDTLDNYGKARSLAVEVADFLGFELADYSTGKEIIRQGTILKLPINKISDNIKAQIDGVKCPDNLNAYYKQGGENLIINIPKNKINKNEWLPILIFYTISLFCSGLGVYLTFRRYPENSEYGNILFIISIVIFWIVATVTVNLIRFIKLLLQKVEIVVSKQHLQINRYGLFRKKQLSIPVEKILNLEVIERYSNSFINRNIIPIRPYIAVITHENITYFGGGLNLSELHWIRAEIYRKLLIN